MSSVINPGLHDRSLSPVTVEMFDHEGRVEEYLNTGHLQSLMSEFQKPEYMSAGLDMDTFCNAIHRHISKDIVSREKLALLFMKIDTSCDGHVDWDEFCTYMLVAHEEKQEDKARIQGTQVNTATPLHKSNLKLKSPIKSIIYQPIYSRGFISTNRLITVTEDGLLSVYKSNLTSIKSTQLQLSQKKMQAVSATILPVFGKVAISFTNRTLKFYDLPCSVSEEVCQLVGLSHTVMCMAFYESTATDTLLLGDMGGGVHIIKFPEHRFHLLNATDAGEFHNDIPISKLASDIYMYEVAHSDWIEHITGYHAPGTYISCSSTSTGAIVVRDSTIRKFNVPKGARSFDFSRQSNVLVSGGVDCLIRIWNPHVNYRANAILEGHKASIIRLSIQTSSSSCRHDGETERPVQQFIISLSDDAVLKLWSLHTHTCMVTLQRAYLDIDRYHPITAHYYDAHSATILFANEQLRSISLGRELMHNHKETFTHNQPLTDVKYNPLFGQVVTSCRDSIVNVWSLVSGEQLLKFGPAHQQAEVTRLAFDRSKRRLLTAASDGSTKLWNFNVGLALMKLQSGFRTEIQSMLELHDGRVVSGGWDRTINLFTQCDGTSYYVECNNSISGKGHTSDVMGILELRPMYIASCTINGELFTWKVLDRILPLRQYRLRETVHGCSLFGMLLYDSKEESKNNGYLILWGSGNGSGCLWLFNLTAGKICCEVCVSKYPVRDTAVTDNGQYIVSADASGMVKVWNTSDWKHGLNGNEKIKEPQLFNKWTAHTQAITRISVAEVPIQRSMEYRVFVLTASEDCTCRLWSLEGDFIGTFGQSTVWNIDDLWKGHHRRPSDVAELIRKRQEQQQNLGTTHPIHTCTEFERDYELQTSSFIFQSFKSSNRHGKGVPCEPQDKDNAMQGQPECTDAKPSQQPSFSTTRHRRESTVNSVMNRVTLHQRRLESLPVPDDGAGFRHLECGSIASTPINTLPRPKSYNFIEE